MRGRYLNILVVLVFATIAWAGSDVWKSKPYQQWDQKDVMQILRESPWAKPNVQASGSWRPLGQSTSDDAGAYNTRSSNVADGGAQKTKEALSGIRAFNVYWWSSRTMRAASRRQAVLHGTMTETDAEKLVAQVPEEYSVLVVGNDMSVFAERGEKAFADAAWLELKKSKTKLSATHVKFERDPQEKIVSVTFYFAKKDKSGNATIVPEEKEIDFFLKVGDAKVVTYFEPKKMADAQGLDL